MKWTVFLLFIMLFLYACTNRQREEELNKREQAVALKEKILQEKEASLIKREHILDSTIYKDTSIKINPSIAGTWQTKMTCTETTCAGSAVGDTKTEEWELSYEGNTLIAKAHTNEQLIRTYKGFYTGNTIELVESRDSTEANVKMVVRLRLADETHMEGQREITRKDCKIIYDIKLAMNKE